MYKPSFVPFVLPLEKRWEVSEKLLGVLRTRHRVLKSCHRGLKSCRRGLKICKGFLEAFGVSKADISFEIRKLPPDTANSF